MRHSCIQMLFLSLILSALCCETAQAASRKDRAVRDSLWNVAIEHNLHGRFEESNAVFQDLIDNDGLSLRRKKEAWWRMGRMARLSGDYRSFCKYERLRGARIHKFFLALAELPPRCMERHGHDVSVDYIVDSVIVEGEYRGGLIKIPVTVNGHQEWFTIDNGMEEYNLVSESFAAKCGIRTIDVEAYLSGSTGTKTTYHMGVLDSLSIGSLTFRNLLFSIVPDNSVENPYIDLSALLGSGFFRLAGEMLFLNKERKLVFPERQEELESNLTLNGLDEHLVKVGVFGDILQFQLDLGSARTHLNGYYFERNKEWIQDTFPTDTTTTYGLGGAKQERFYVVDSLSFTACDGVYRKKQVRIETSKVDIFADYDGLLGSDFILSFDKVALNLRNMYLYVE